MTCAASFACANITVWPKFDPAQAQLRLDLWLGVAQFLSLPKSAVPVGIYGIVRENLEKSEG